jgi:hypothetical protein
MTECHPTRSANQQVVWMSALYAPASRAASWFPPTVAWKSGGFGLMFCDRAAP